MALPGTSIVPDDVVTVRTVEKGHGRVDERVLTISSLLREYQGWPYLDQAFQLIRTSTHPGRAATREVCYGITRAPATIAGAARVLSCRTWALAH